MIWISVLVLFVEKVWRLRPRFGYRYDQSRGKLVIVSLSSLRRAPVVDGMRRVSKCRVYSGYIARALVHHFEGGSWSGTTPYPLEEKPHLFKKVPELYVPILYGA